MWHYSFCRLHVQACHPFSKLLYDEDNLEDREENAHIMHGAQQSHPTACGGGLLELRWCLHDAAERCDEAGNETLNELLPPCRMHARRLIAAEGELQPCPAV